MATQTVHRLMMFCIILIHNVHSACNAPLDLNTATVRELDTLPFVTASAAYLITQLRPICSPNELTTQPKKISGITSRRLNVYWKWYNQQDCAETCCRAVASCASTPDLSNTYSWIMTNFSTCTATCDGGTQYRTVTCGNDTHTVADALCLASTQGRRPPEKQLCNTRKCPVYEWAYSEWSACDSECKQSRVAQCYETVYNEEEEDSLCAHEEPLATEQHCDRCLTMDNTEIVKITDDIQVEIDLLHDYNQQNCHTTLYRNVDDVDTLITRRACSIDITLRVLETSAPVDVSLVDKSWFYLEATLLAKADESVGSTWDDHYLSFSALNKTVARITISIPSDGNIGHFLCNLYYQHQGLSSNRMLLKEMSLLVLFNPYSADDDVFMRSITDRHEYVENEDGLIWQGSSSDNAGYSWNYGHFEYKNLLIAMKMLDRLSLEYRNDLVLISRHISYAVGKDICHGKWGGGSYTTGRPYGGYYCSKTRTCHDPLSWRGTTQLFDVYRDELNYAYSVQYCQCFVFAGVTTTVGRALGIPTRPVSTFQSAHDTDFNRGIDKYWIYDVETRAYDTTSYGGDSVWSFHVWNEVYFKRTDFIGSATSYNMAGWQAIDATPQEQSYGGNPALGSDDVAVYQMGPASLLLVRKNMNSNECKHAPVNHERFGCFDNEFVISEVNSNYNFWKKKSTDGDDAPFVLESSYKTDPWGDTLYTIGQQISTKKPAKSISAKCLDATINDCSDELLDVTYSNYKYREPSGPSTPTDTSNYYTQGQSRQPPGRRRVLLLGETEDDDLDLGGIEYEIDSYPKLWHLSPMIIAEEAATNTALFGSDNTFGMMSIRIDSYFDSTLSVFCSFTVTAHDYTGAQDNNTIKVDRMNMSIEAGDTGECLFDVNYTEYAPWTDLATHDGSEIPQYLKLVLSVSVFEFNTSEPYQVIIDEREYDVCAPVYTLRDRIICHTGLKWLEPKYDLEYECKDNMIGVADGFCDDANNIDGCFDGGDCCEASCVPSDAYPDSCSRFDCVDERVNVDSVNYFDCHEPLMFIGYVDELIESEICVVEDGMIPHDFACTHEIWTQATGDACLDAVLSLDGEYGDTVSCFNETINSISTQMRAVIAAVIDCYRQLDKSDNGTWVLNATDATATTDAGVVTVATKDNDDADANTKQKDSSSSNAGLIAAVIGLCVMCAALAIWYMIRRRQESDDEFGYKQMETDDKVEMEPKIVN
eukprot:223718_1